jgi:alpha-mannosidase
MLRVSFPVNLRSENASFDIQYGYVKRNTHRNTSWDIAKFETAVHRYADISENDYGVALLNDCKYGCKVYDNVLDLNLLRSPSYPDPDADTGEHEFLYSFLPHQGALVNSNVMCEAEKINQRPVIFDSKRGEGIPVPVEISGHGVCLEALKKARNDNSTVVRLVETKGGYSKCNMKINGFHACSETNLVEWEDTPPVAVPREGKELEFSPFEIKTMKLLRKKI